VSLCILSFLDVYKYQAFRQMKTTGLLVFTHSIAQHYKDSEGYTDMCAMVLNSNAGVVIIWDNMEFWARMQHAESAGKPQTKETGRMQGVRMQSRDAECREEVRMRIEVF